jgi:large subunit ribosomal protein L21
MSESAVIRTGGHQFRVSVGDVLEIPNIEGEAGQETSFPEVLLHESEGEVVIGAPTVPGATVLATIVAQTKGPKIRGFKYKPKKHSKRQYGHRQQLTRLRVTAISARAATE